MDIELDVETSGDDMAASSRTYPPVLVQFFQDTHVMMDDGQVGVIAKGTRLFVAATVVDPTLSAKINMRRKADEVAKKSRARRREPIAAHVDDCQGERAESSQPPEEII